MNRPALLARRRLLFAGGTLAGGVLGACRAAHEPDAPPAATSFGRIRAICFDLFTLFDPRSVLRVIEAAVPEQGARLWEVWRTRQFEYSWLRASSGRYADFQVVTGEALTFATREVGVALSSEQRSTLVGAYSELEPWPDAHDALSRWQRAGLLLAPLSNYSPAMLTRVISRAGLGGVFTSLVSTDAARTFKPDPRAYALGPATLGLPRESIAFAAFGGWDAAGAKWFGFPTFWVNRLGVAAEALLPPPDAAGPSFAELAAFVES
jgi:2-haloacid dehalogenase